jgi:ankyrin repeat protein
MPTKAAYMLALPPTGFPRRPAHLHSLLALAAESGWVEMLRIMVAADADPNTRSLFSKLPLLHIASKKGHVTTCAMLLDGGADIEMRCIQDSRTALMLAAMHGHLQLVSLLLSRGANIDAIDNGGRTALILATMGQVPTIVDTLLAAGADPHIRESERGCTAAECIHWGTRAMRTRMAEVFIAHGVQVPPHEMPRAPEVGQ